MAKAEEDKEREEDAEDKETADASEDENDESPQDAASNRRLLLKLNGEVLELQREMRSLILGNPALMPEVDVGQKERIFCLVHDLLEQTLGSRRADRDRPHGLQETLEMLQAAAGWDSLASVSLEGRILRVAALVDGPLLAQMLQETKTSARTAREARREVLLPSCFEGHPGEMGEEKHFSEPWPSARCATAVPACEPSRRHPGHLDSFEHLLLNMKRRFGAAVIVPKVPGEEVRRSLQVLIALTVTATECGKVAWSRYWNEALLSLILALLAIDLVIQWVSETLGTLGFEAPHEKAQHVRSQEYIDHHRPIDALVGILLFPRARPPRRLHVSIVLLLGTLCTADLALAVGAGGARVSLPLVLFAVTECGYVFRMVRPWLHFVLMSLALVLSVLVLLLLPCQRRLAKATQTRWRVPWAAKLLLAVGCGLSSSFPPLLIFHWEAAADVLLEASLAANATPFLHQTLARPDVISGSAIAGVPVTLKTAWEAQSDWSKEDMEQPDIESAPPVRVLTPLDCSDWKLREEKQRRLCIEKIQQFEVWREEPQRHLFEQKQQEQQQKRDSLDVQRRERLKEAQNAKEEAAAKRSLQAMMQRRLRQLEAAQRADARRAALQQREELRERRLERRSTQLAKLSSLKSINRSMDIERQRRKELAARELQEEHLRRKAERAEALAFERQRLWKVRQQERQETKASCEALKEELLRLRARNPTQRAQSAPALRAARGVEELAL
eukprot:g9437.t1